ncbi:MULTISPECIES: cell division protein FtsQ/DivIB [Arthrobacter]|uniref:FtsQ-type POTRA domain-containing protein n=1 Tax=Arthrobacter sunyaminii TaxID=2816859 RepID=A0A975XM00_9MICC|nr:MULTISPECIES: FtsQ-type POTRA domain-containing protein [Arthrobacter]MBO0906666.1 FtsQ-type POTRA domain-containing protein [Arthrobacter sunyaminii]QWQ37446.1 FtsQ-type POTRA domain-containing protein [Arthrobacter sunyaminii]
MASKKPRRPEVDPTRHAGGGRSSVRRSAGYGDSVSRERRLHGGAGRPNLADAKTEGHIRTEPGSGNGESVTATVLAFPEPPVRKRRRWLLISVSTAVVLLGAFLAFLFLSPALALKTVTVQGNSLLPEEEVHRALQPLMGEPLTTIDDGDVAGLLADRPEVAGVDVVALPPSEIVVTITERVPVAVLQSGNAFSLIDEDGLVIGTAANRAEARLPLIDGGSEAVNSAVFSTVTSVLSVLPENVLAQLDHAAATSVDSVELKLVNGQTVFWGSAESNVAKARVLEALLLMPPKDPPISVFDVSTPTAPVTR